MIETERKHRGVRGGSGFGLVILLLVAAAGCGNPAPSPGPKAPRPQAGEQVLPIRPAVAVNALEAP